MVSGIPHSTPPLIQFPRFFPASSTSPIINCDNNLLAVRLSCNFYLSWHGSTINQCKQVCLDYTSLTGYSSSCFAIGRVSAVTDGKYVGILFMSHGDLVNIHETTLIRDRTSQQAFWWSHRRRHVNHVILQ